MTRPVRHQYLPNGPQPWLVTAFVDGPSLADAVASRGPLPPGPALTLAAGLAEGLEVIHAMGVVHRDLKPSDVLLADDGPRIIDFGISHAANASGLTRTGWVTGSPGFMSPEQAEGRPAGPASDIFSLGSVLAFAATGHEPFGAGTAPALLYRVVHGQPDRRRTRPAQPDGGWPPGRSVTAPPASHPGNNPSLVVPRREHAGIRSPRPAFPSTVTTARAHDTGPRPAGRRQAGAHSGYVRVTRDEGAGRQAGSKPDLPWAPSAEAASKRAAEAAAPASALRGLTGNGKARKGAAYAAAAALVAALWGGYIRGWQSTGFRVNGQLWDWLTLLLLPVVLGTIPLWIQDKEYIGKGRRLIYAAAITAWTGLAIAGYPIPLNWTGFRGQMLWGWLDRLVLPQRSRP